MNLSGIFTLATTGVPTINNDISDAENFITNVKILSKTIALPSALVTMESALAAVKTEVYKLTNDIRGFHLAVAFGDGTTLVSLVGGFCSTGLAAITSLPTEILDDPGIATYVAKLWKDAQATLKLLAIVGVNIVLPPVVSTVVDEGITMIGGTTTQTKSVASLPQVHSSDPTLSNPRVTSGISSLVPEQTTETVEATEVDETMPSSLPTDIVIANPETQPL